MGPLSLPHPPPLLAPASRTDSLKSEPEAEARVEAGPRALGWGPRPGIWTLAPFLESPLRQTRSVGTSCCQVESVPGSCCPGDIEGLPLQTSARPRALLDILGPAGAPAYLPLLTDTISKPVPPWGGSQDPQAEAPPNSYPSSFQHWAPSATTYPVCRIEELSTSQVGPTLCSLCWGSPGG